MRKFSLKTKASFRPNHKRIVLAHTLAWFCAALVVLYLAGNLLGSAVSLITAPIYGVRHWLAESSGTVPMYFRSRNELLQEIDMLKDRIVTLGGQDATTARLSAENAEYRALLSSKDPARIAAGVVARPPYIPYDVLLIDRGSAEGVKERAVVYYANDHAIGFVGRVFEHSALVTLFSTAGVETTVYVIGPNIFTTAYGEGGGVLRVSVPQGMPLQEGDTVIMPSLEAGILGQVRTTESVSTQPEQFGYVTLAAPLQSLRTVAVSGEVIAPISFEEAQQHVKGLDYSALQIEIPAEYRVEMPLFPTTTSATGTPATSSIPSATSSRTP